MSIIFDDFSDKKTLLFEFQSDHHLKFSTYIIDKNRL